MDFTAEPQRIISLCTGIGGIERGIELTGIELQPILYLEREAFIVANLVAAMEAGFLAAAPVFTDITKFDGRPFRGKIHGITGGYPCPGESLAGLREGHLYKGWIWPSIARIIKATKPFWCFFENVDDHLTGTYPIVQRSLRQMGYAVEAGIYSAEEVGAPHERKRLFILAISYAYSKQLETGNTASAWKSWREFSRSSGLQKMAHPYSAGQQEQWPDGKQKEQDHPGVGLPGTELGNADTSKGPQKLTGGNKRNRSNAGRNKAASGPGLAGAELAHTKSFGHERFPWTNPGDIEKAIRADAWSRPDGTDTASKWPAGQGAYQHPWEEPRTVEPSLGVSADGYRFKEDFLRALGNSVVPETAAVAFTDLLKKHRA